MELSPLSYRPPCQSFSCLLSSRPRPSPLFVGVRRSCLRLLFFSFFRAPVGRLFGRPLLSSVTPWPAFLPPGLFFTLCAVRRSPRRLLCRPTSASGAFMSAGLQPPFLGLLVPDRSLPWPPCACVASLAAFYASFLAVRRNGSLAALWASSLAARCTACLAARRAGSLAAQCTASLAARCTACLAMQRPGSLAAQCAAWFAAQCAACFATRCVACFATRCVACFASSLAARCAACFAARRAACFAARGVACLAATCAASLASSRAVFLDAQAGPPSASVFSRLRLPFRGPLFSAPFMAWSLPLATSLHRFFTSLFLFRSRLRVAPSSWVLHTSGLTGMGTRPPRVLPPPPGTFRLLETRQYVTTD